MMAVGALLRDLETTMGNGKGHERELMIANLTDLFLATASQMDEEQIGVFDVVIGRLSRAIELRARMELAERLAPIPNAPPAVVRQLALDEIAVARPVLLRSPRLSDQDLVAVSAAKGRDHMLAISERPHLRESVTDFLILRGGRVVTHAVAANRTARFSRHGMGVLVMRAGQDEVLQATLGQRGDLPAELAEQLMALAKLAARRRLDRAVRPGFAKAVEHAVERGAEAVAAAKAVPVELASLGLALAEVRALQAAGRLDEAQLRNDAREVKLEHAICGFGLLAGLSLPAAEQTLMGPDREAVLLVSRALDWSWETTAALISLRRDLGRSDAALERAQQSFEQIGKSTAERVLGFLKARDAAP